MSYQGTIEVGKLYRSRRNEQVRIYATDGLGRYSIHGATKDPGNGWAVLAWSPQGLASNGLSGDTIVGEWKEPESPRYRPFSEDELSFLIDRVIRRSDCSGWLGKVGWINDCRVLCGQEWNSPEDLFTHWEIEQPDGTWGPCGVLTSTGSCCGVIVGARAPFTDSWGIMGRPVDSWESMGRGRPSETVE